MAALKVCLIFLEPEVDHDEPLAHLNVLFIGF